MTYWCIFDIILASLLQKGRQKMLPILETERLILRPLTEDDYLDCFKWCGDPRVNEYMIYTLYKNAEDVKEWLKTVNTDEKHIDYGFVLKESGKLIGSGGIYYHEERDIWSIGYNLAFDGWGKGYTTEAISKIIEYAKNRFHIKEIYGTFAVDNIGSRRVMEKLGMTYFEDTEYSKFDGSRTYKAKTYKKVF